MYIHTCIQEYVRACIYASDWFRFSGEQWLVRYTINCAWAELLSFSVWLDGERNGNVDSRTKKPSVKVCACWLFRIWAPAWALWSCTWLPKCVSLWMAGVPSLSGLSISHRTTSAPPLSLPPAWKKGPLFLQWREVFPAVNVSPLGPRAPLFRFQIHAYLSSYRAEHTWSLSESINDVIVTCAPSARPQAQTGFSGRTRTQEETKDQMLAMCAAFRPTALRFWTSAFI